MKIIKEEERWDDNSITEHLSLVAMFLIMQYAKFAAAAFATGYIAIVESLLLFVHFAIEEEASLYVTIPKVHSETKLHQKYTQYTKLW